MLLRSRFSLRIYSALLGSRLISKAGHTVFIFSPKHKALYPQRYCKSLLKLIVTHNLLENLLVFYELI